MRWLGIKGCDVFLGMKGWDMWIVFRLDLGWGLTVSLVMGWMIVFLAGRDKGENHACGKGALFSQDVMVSLLER